MDLPGANLILDGAGGGGGAGGVGANGQYYSNYAAGSGANGGSGKAISITGSSVNYAPGGPGAGHDVAARKLCKWFCD